MMVSLVLFPPKKRLGRSSVERRQAAARLARALRAGEVETCSQAVHLLVRISGWRTGTPYLAQRRQRWSPGSVAVMGCHPFICCLPLPAHARPVQHHVRMGMDVRPRPAS